MIKRVDVRVATTFTLNAPPLHPRQFSIAFAFVSILCCPFPGMVMVVSSCPPSLHWERHQRLLLSMAIGVVSCEFADTPASSISSSLAPRSHVFATFDGYEASHLFFPAVAVSGSIVYMKGCDFVGSSCVEVPVANPSHALGFFFIRLLSVHVLVVVCRLPLRCRVGRQCLSRRCCPSCCFFPLRRTRTFFILCAFLLSMWAHVFLVCVALIGVLLSFTGCPVCPVAESSTDVTIAQNREQPTSPSDASGCGSPEARGCSLTHRSHLTFRFGGIVSLCTPASGAGNDPRTSPP